MKLLTVSPPPLPQAPPAPPAGCSTPYSEKQGERWGLEPPALDIDLSIRQRLKTAPDGPPAATQDRYICPQKSIHHVHAGRQRTDLCDSLQAHVVALVLALFQLLQGHSHFSDEFIPPESVHVAHTQPLHARTHTHRAEQRRSRRVSAGSNRTTQSIQGHRPPSL